MAVTSGDFQSTPLTPRAGISAAHVPAEAVQRAADPTPAQGSPDPNQIGVIFVHGIGSQPPSETFLDWSAPIVRVLSTWRLAHNLGVDPVRRAEYSFSGASSPYLEIAIPEWANHPAQTWRLTEAWWAALVRPPALGTMTAYVRHVLPQVIGGIKAGYETREQTWSERRRVAEVAARQRVAAGRARLEAAARGSGARAVDQEAGTFGAQPETREGLPAASVAAEPETAEALLAAARDAAQAQLVLDELRPRRAWRWIKWLDRGQKELTILSAGPALVLGNVVLALYAPFRRLPIKALQDAAVFRSADSFLTNSFGDLPDLLDDPVQAANVRARLAQTIQGLYALGCGRIVLVAHSGGAIVSFTTLMDPTYAKLPVHKVVTLGEGLQLAWRLENAAVQGLPPGSRLSGDLLAARKDLKWVDYWGTYDPAPGGYLVPPPNIGVTVDAVGHPVTNRMSIADDHGGYWDNDEGFVIPLLREIDTASGLGESRFYRDQALRAVRIERRRQRVAVLALWRWIGALGAVVPIAIATVTGLTIAATNPGPDRLGREAAAFWAAVPGRQLLSGPIDWVASWGTWPAFLRPFGEWLVGSALIGLAFYVLAAYGISRWSTWDTAERTAARQQYLAPLDRRLTLVEIALLSVAVFELAALVLFWLWRT